MDNKHEIDENDPLKEYYREIADGMNPPPKLVNKVKGGVTVKLFPKSVHVKRFVQAAACYVIGVALLLSAVILLPRLWERGAPVGTQPPEPAGTTTVLIGEAPEPIDKRDLLTKPDLTDLQKELYYAVWDSGKDDLDEKSTINRLDLGNYVFKLRELYICFPLNTHGGLTQLFDRQVHQNIVGYSFFFFSIPLEVFADGNFYPLQDALDAGILTPEDIAAIWKDYYRVDSLDGQPISNDRIRKDSLAIAGFIPRRAETDTALRLFDGSYTSSDQLSGTVPIDACIFFDLDAPVKLSAYAMVNGSEATSAHFNPPNEWSLYATNDPAVAALARANSADETYLAALFADGTWDQLYWGGFEGLSTENDQKSFIAIPEYKRGEYQYYCLYTEYFGLSPDLVYGLQIAELELYTD